MKKSTRALSGMDVLDAARCRGGVDGDAGQVRHLEHLRTRRDHHRDHPHRRGSDRDRHRGAAGGVFDSEGEGGLGAQIRPTGHVNIAFNTPSDLSELA